MTLDECARRASATWIVEGDGNVDIHDIVVSDLMSDVLVTEHDDFLLVTSLTSEQVARTADIVDAKAILLSNGKRPQPALEALASQQGIPLMTSPLPTFDVCRVLAGCKETNEDV